MKTSLIKHSQSGLHYKSTIVATSITGPTQKLHCYGVYLWLLAATSVAVKLPTFKYPYSHQES